MKDALWMMDIAEAIAARSNCLRAQVGCVLFDNKKRILATGYNSPPQGYPHCSKECPGQAPGGGDDCLSVHAEINALIQCGSPDKVAYVACSTLPCYRCAKALLNTKMEVLIYRNTHDEERKVLHLLMQQPKLIVIKV